jgi:site-specific DNA recombinase
MPPRPELTPALKPVGIWLRVSTEDQAKGESPEHHEKRARAYAEAKGWRVVEVYHLEGVSGKAVMHHPEARRMLADLKAGRITALIFSKLARLARNTKELLDLADLFRDYNGDLVSLGESIDTSTPAGRLFYTMIAALSAWEREEIAARIATSVPIRAKLGKPLGGPAPYGYQWKDRKLIIHPQEAVVRRQVYELFAEHQRYKTVAARLNAAGHRTRKGKPFTDTDVQRFLTDPSAKGLHRANYSSMREGKKTLKPEHEWVFTQVEPIIPVALWEACNRLIDGRRRPDVPVVARKPVHLFAGLVFCQCGGKMYVPSNTPKYVCQGCRNKIPAQDLEHVFREQLRTFFLSPDEVQQYLQQANATLRHKEQLVAALQGERQKVASAMDRVYDLYIKAKISGEGFGARYKPLEERAKQLDGELPRLQAEADLLTVSFLSKDHLAANARDLYDRWPGLSHADKRKIVESVTARIDVGKGELHIDLCYLPGPSQELATGPPSLKAALWHRLSSLHLTRGCASRVAG